MYIVKLEGTGDKWKKKSCFIVFFVSNLCFYLNLVIIFLEDLLSSAHQNGIFL